MCISIRRNRVNTYNCLAGKEIISKESPNMSGAPTLVQSTTETKSLCAPKSKGVRFSPSVAVHELLNVPTASVMTPEEKVTSWYSVEELECFKTDARDAGRRVRQEIGECDSITYGHAIIHKPQHDRSEDDDAVCARGLEQRIFTDRQRNKFFAVRAVIECQRRHRLRGPSDKNALIDPSLRLAAVSIKMTRWAAGIARNAARGDFAAAYPEIRPYLDVIIPLAVVPDFPTLSFKRKPSPMEETDRRVRRRVDTSESSMLVQ